MSSQALEFHLYSLQFKSSSRGKTEVARKLSGSGGSAIPSRVYLRIVSLCTSGDSNPGFDTGIGSRSIAERWAQIKATIFSRVPI